MFIISESQSTGRPPAAGATGGRESPRRADARLGLGQTKGPESGRWLREPARPWHNLSEPQCELILHRSIHLNEGDRRFLKQILSDGRKLRDLASVIAAARKGERCGSSEQVEVLPRSCAKLKNVARILHRRFHRLAARLLSVECAYLLSPDVHLCPTRARICRMRFLQGLTIRQIGSMLALPIHTVRRICEHASAQAQIQSQIQSELQARVQTQLQSSRGHRSSIMFNTSPSGRMP